LKEDVGFVDALVNIAVDGVDLLAFVFEKDVIVDDFNGAFFILSVSF
jgi:hypothetical protein